MKILSHLLRDSGNLSTISHFYLVTLEKYYFQPTIINIQKLLLLL